MALRAHLLKAVARLGWLLTLLGPAMGPPRARAQRAGQHEDYDAGQVRHPGR